MPEITLYFTILRAEPYMFISDKVLEIDAFNPMAASGLVQAFSQMSQLTADNQSNIKAQLEKIRGHQGLSNNVFEIVDKILSG